MSVIYIKNVIDFESVAKSLQTELKTMELKQIYSEFKNFFYGICDSEYVFYSKAQVDEHIEFLKKKFLEEYYIYPHYIASQLDMEVISA